MLTVVANKSILGIGATAEITGGGLQLGTTTRPGNNVIIRNIKFSNASDDSISITNRAHHVWVDHCEFTNGFDGLVDVKRESDFVTISWNKFYNHVKTSLVGHSDTFTADIGHLRVTYHHNHFDGTGSRHPRVRFGNPVHVFNNYYRGNAEYGVASTENAGVLVEGNYFENVVSPCFVGFAESSRAHWWSATTSSSIPAYASPRGPRLIRELITITHWIPPPVFRRSSFSLRE